MRLAKRVVVIWVYPVVYGELENRFMMYYSDCRPGGGLAVEH